MHFFILLSSHHILKFDKLDDHGYYFIFIIKLFFQLKDM